MMEIWRTDSDFIFSKQFYGLLILGPVFWSVYYIYSSPSVDLSWPQHHGWLFLSLVVLYPVLEEIVFRGLVQEYWQRRIRTSTCRIVSDANIITSLCFAALHLFFQPWQWALAVFFPSLVFGYAKERYQTLLAPIVLHVFYNAGFHWLFYQPA